MRTIIRLSIFLAALLPFKALAQIQFSPYLAIPTGSWPEVVAIGDLNNDGRKDVAMGLGTYGSSANDYKVLVFLQNTSGNLNTPIAYSYPNLYPGIKTMNIADLNHDGREDIIIGYNTKVAVFYQNASGSLDPFVPFETNQSVIAVKCGDLNSDGLTDFAVSYANIDYFSIYYQSAGGTFTSQNFSKPNFMTYKEIEIGDVNNDSKNDIVCLCSNPSGIYTYLQNGSNSFDNYTTTAITGLSGIGIGDLNSDGLTDVAYSKGGNTPNAKTGILYQNAVSHSFENAIEIQAYDIPEPIEIADLNNDTKNEIIEVNGGWMKTTVYEQSGNVFGGYSLFQIPYATSYNNQGMAVGDINNDNKKDIAIADYNNGLVILYNISTLDVNDNSIKSNVLIYPNPAVDYLKVEHTSNLTLDFEIVDTNGKLLQKNILNNDSQIDIRQLQTGMYFLILKNGTEKATFKFIKN